MKSLRCPRRRLQNPHSSKPEAQAEGIVGSIKKLPTKNTTPHIAKQPIPEKGLNAKGQMKVTDANGKVRFINMREPRIMGEGGAPVKGG
jgi:hypothetical protein